MSFKKQHQGGQEIIFKILQHGHFFLYHFASLKNFIEIFLTLTTVLDFFCLNSGKFVFCKETFAKIFCPFLFLRVCPFPTILTFFKKFLLKIDFRIQNVANVLIFNLYKKFLILEKMCLKKYCVLYMEYV